MHAGIHTSHPANLQNSWRIGGDHHDTFSGPIPGTEGVIELFAGLSNASGVGGWNYGDMIYTVRV